MFWPIYYSYFMTNGHYKALQSYTGNQVATCVQQLKKK